MNEIAPLPKGGPAGPGAHATPLLAEADRLMTICNSCRYCEGLCAVFPAMEMRRGFSDGDLDYLANLCHGCGACYVDCQFSPPHDFNVNVPAVFSALRKQSYARAAWPQGAGRLFARNGLWVAFALAGSIAAFLIGFVLFHAPAALFASDSAPGSFYRLLPHDAMAALFGGVFLFSILALAFSLRRFWRQAKFDAASPLAFADFWQAGRDAAALRYLDGGGDGCFNEDTRPERWRRSFHHLTFYGFGLCFAATSVASLYHFVLHREAPYPWYDLPVILGTLGGLGMTIGPIGLFWVKIRRDKALTDPGSTSMEHAFLAMLWLTAVSGLLLLFFRAGPAMGLLLALHLGVVFALFVSLPYGKFVHGLYRFAALVQYARERRSSH